MADTVTVVSVDEALSYLGIDYADDMVNHNIERAIKTADSYLKGSIGENYPIDDPRSKELALIIISDLYDNRGMQNSGTGYVHKSNAISGNVRKLVNDFSIQLRCELRSKANE